MTTPMGAVSDAVDSQLLADVQLWAFTDWFKYGFPCPTPSHARKQVGVE